VAPLSRKLRKLRRAPIAYCIDSKHALLQAHGARMFARQTHRYREIGAANAHQKITVVMTAYNTGHLIKAAVKSVLAQSHQNISLMVIDDASTDDTLEVLKQLSLTDSRLRVFHSSKNHGTYWSKNWCLAMAQTEFVAFHDSDDRSDPDRLLIQLGAMLEKPGVMAATCRWRRVDGEGNELMIDGRATRMAAISLMIRRKPVLEKAGFFDSVRISADTEFITRLQRIFGVAKVRHMRQLLYTGLLRDGSLTTGVNSGFSWKSEGRSHVRELSGDRAAYHRDFHDWHAANAGIEAALFMPYPLENRKFPASDAICRGCDDPEIDAVVEATEAKAVLDAAS